MITSKQFAQILLSVYQEWNQFLATASGYQEFTYAGLNCFGLFGNGKWTIVVMGIDGSAYEYTSMSKRNLLRDFASYIMGA